MMTHQATTQTPINTIGSIVHDHDFSLKVENFSAKCVARQKKAKKEMAQPIPVNEAPLFAKKSSQELFGLVVEAKAFGDSTEHHAFVDVYISPEAALDWVSKHNHVNQRRLSTLHVAEMAEAIRRGQFRQYTNISFAILNGEPLLVNGQHTLNAIYLSQLPIWLSVEFINVSDEKEVSELYSLYDNGRLRSFADNMGDIGTELELKTMRERNSLGAAVNMLNLDFANFNRNHSAVIAFESKSSELKKNLMRQWGVEARLYFDAIRGATVANKAAFYRSAVVAVALVTIRDQGEAALNFWREAAYDSGMMTSDPRKELANWLRSNPTTKSQRTQHIAAINCWNAWFVAGPRKIKQAKIVPKGVTGSSQITIQLTHPFTIRGFKDDVAR